MLGQARMHEVQASPEMGKNWVQQPKILSLSLAANAMVVCSPYIFQASIFWGKSKKWREFDLSPKAVLGCLCALHILCHQLLPFQNTQKSSITALLAVLKYKTFIHMLVVVNSIRSNHSAVVIYSKDQIGWHFWYHPFTALLFRWD